jgi:hypothetical protein
VERLYQRNTGTRQSPTRPRELPSATPQERSARDRGSQTGDHPARAEIVQLEEVLQGYSSLLHDVTKDRDRFRDDWKAMTEEASRWRK